MPTNNTNTKLIYPDLSYQVTGICFEVHNEVDRFGRERQYGDLIEKKLAERNISYIREFRIGPTGNTVDFFIDQKLFLEIKAKRLILKEDFYQAQRYLQEAGIPLALLINFRNRYLKPIRIVKIDTDTRKKFLQDSYH